MTTFDISLVVPGLPFTDTTLETQSLGGSESAGAYMARALAKLGHRVTVFSNIDKPVRFGSNLYYLPIVFHKQYAEHTLQDVMIVQRLPELFSTPHSARFAALWCHDLALGRSEPKIKGVAWNYDKIFVLSEFMREQYKKICGLPDNLLFLTRNGIDLEAVAKARQLSLDGIARSGWPSVEITRDPFQLVYPARPERGLDVLLSEIMPRVLAREPRAHLVVCAYHNPVDHLREFYDACNRAMQSLGDRCHFAGNLTKQQLYMLYLQSGLYVYPVPSKLAPEFDEIYCIGMLEAQACGLPVVTSKRGALPETLTAGVLIDKPVHTENYYDEFADHVVQLMHDKAKWLSYSLAGPAFALNMDWLGVAEQWSELFEREIRNRSSNPVTLANHFWRHSDIYAAREVIAQAKSDPKITEQQHRGLAVVDQQIRDYWAFLDEPDGFRKQYEKIGATHDANVIEWTPSEPRYMVLKDWLKSQIDAKPGIQPDMTSPVVRQPYKVLDYGCAHGGYAINLLKELPDLRITGVDLDQHGIEMAYGFAEKYGVSNRWCGVVGGHERVANPDIPELEERYDCVLAQEVLEHVAEPWEVLRALEQRVKDGGIMYITVPFGPWEYTDYKRYPYRAHIWEFDLHDLYDMLDLKGHESQLTVNAMPAPQPLNHNPYTNEPQGWWVVMYKVTPKTRGVVGRINMQRKLWCQRPRQTVSVNIMAGGLAVDETVLWCLRSLEHVADQFVVVDCGLTPFSKALIEATINDKRLTMVQGVDPKMYGFETPRNMGLEHCWGDWVLWIDTDEKLLQPEAITKYLRPNCFNGYSIRQHHFAVDTHFDPDLPVRLFRNPVYTESGMRFFGYIHEHPETELNSGPGLTIVLGDVHIPHLGYLIESSRKERFARNLPMLNADIKRYPDRMLQKHFMMRDHMLLCSYELQANGGQVTERIRARAHEVIRLWKEHFKGKGHFSNIDPITYYSQANMMLGQGFDAYIQVAADKLDAKPNGALKARFTDMDDYMTEVNRRATEAAALVANPYY